MDTKLSDFTKEQLLFASMVFKDSMIECNDKIQLIMSVQDNMTKTELLFHWMSQRDFASHWLTQIDVALVNKLSTQP